MAEEDTSANFEPLVKLEKVEVQTGEEGETVLYKHRSRLYRFDAESGEWKERGTGDVRLLHHAETGKVRIVLREDKTFKLRMNHNIIPGLELRPNIGSDRAWTWACTDYSDPEPATQTFAIKFKNAEIANGFKAKYEEAQEIVEGKREAPAGVPAEDDQKESENPWAKIVEDGKLLKPISEKQLGELWAKYDADGNKFIEASELEALMLDLVRAVVAAAEKPAEDGLLARLEEQVPQISANVLKALDKDADGKIDWDEFKGLNDVSIV